MAIVTRPSARALGTAAPHREFTLSCGAAHTLRCRANDMDGLMRRFRLEGCIVRGPEDEVPDEQVRYDRVAQVWCVAAAFERDQVRMRDCVCHGSPARGSHDRVLRSLDDQ